MLPTDPDDLPGSDVAAQVSCEPNMLTMSIDAIRPYLWPVEAVSEQLEPQFFDQNHFSPGPPPWITGYWGAPREQIYAPEQLQCVRSTLWLSI